MFAIPKCKRRLMAVAVPLTLLALAEPANAQANSADTQAPRRNGNTWDWRQWQPDQAQVMRRERQAGVAPSTAQ
jgi:hypothetical protein